MVKKQLRRYGMGAAAVGVLAGAAAFGLPQTAANEVAAPVTAPAETWRPAVRGLTETPERLLPAVVSRTRPVRVVTTALDATGRPVVTAHTATDRTSAAALVRKAQQARGAVGVELDATVRAADVPANNDPLRASQWDFARVRAAEAWPAGTGAGVTVAVIDSGVDVTHPDLAGRVLPGADYILGVEGQSVDPHGHGTHVAGTIAAAAGNGEGIAGLAPDARILPIRVLGPEGAGLMSDVANGIVYAADHGADVINMSISSNMPVWAVSNAIEYARSKGVVVVAAAGNGRAAGSPVSYPAADAGVIAVAATDAAEAVAGYSNRGWYVDVAAPGTDILSTSPIATGMPYRRMNGTSMAAPHVAALAALLKGRDRNLTPDRVEQAITASAVDRGVPGRDDDFGAGRIDAAAAMAAVAPPTTAPAVPSPAASTAPATPAPTTPAPTTPAPTTPAPTTPAPTTPAPSTPAPNGPTTPAPTSAAPSQPTAPPTVRLVRPAAGQLTIAVVGAAGQPVQVQRLVGTQWVTVLTYPAVPVNRLTGLTPGLFHRVVVAGVVTEAIRL